MQKKELNLVTIHNHTFIPDKFKEGGWAMDLGCNDFIMVRYFLEKKLKVIGLDPLKNIIVPQDLLENPNFIFINKACVGDLTIDKKFYYEYINWGANSLYNSPDKLLHKDNPHNNNRLVGTYEVELVTIESLMSEFDIDNFEAIKMDVEGSEYSILETLPNKCANQISIEFHDSLGLNPNTDIEGYHKNLTESLSDYDLVFSDNQLIDEKNNIFQRNDVLYVKKELL